MLYTLKRLEEVLVVMDTHQVSFSISFLLNSCSKLYIFKVLTIKQAVQQKCKPHGSGLSLRWSTRVKVNNDVLSYHAPPPLKRGGASGTHAFFPQMSFLL